MRHLQLCLWTALLSTGLVHSGDAATFSTFSTKDGKVVAVLKGSIVEGDADRLSDIIRVANGQSKFVSGIRLDSYGGDLAEGVRLADIVRNAKMASVVTTGSTCASACFVVFAAGSEKFVSNNAKVGVHGASEHGAETPGSSAATIEMARIVKNLGVPSGVLGKMVVTPPSDVVWLTANDLRGMGATMTGKPAQTTAVPPASAPAQLPSVASSSVQASAAPTWKSFTEGVFNTSAQQNGGKPAFFRNCQPEYKICSNAVFFKSNNGTSMMARTTDDINGNQISREVCSFNDFGDIRKCINWDSGGIRTDMKDANGNWSEVASK